MFSVVEQLPAAEALLRTERCRAILRRLVPEADGVLVTAPVRIYYFSGTLGNGVLWLPLEGEPVLLLRKGLDRARLESPLARIFGFRSYKELPALCREAGSPLGKTPAVDKQGFSWSMADMLQERLPDRRFVSGDAVLERVRACKSEWELRKLRLCGKRHHRCLYEELPRRIRPGMTERDIAVELWNVFLHAGHSGPLRLGKPGEELFLGYVSAGINGLYPTNFDGPLGVRGAHPAAPYGGDAGSVWKPGEPLSVDAAFALEGYMTDKTQIYWSGPVPEAARRAHELCADVQQEAAQSLRPGVRPSDIWKRALDRVARAGYAETFMGFGPERVGFLGHGIGLVMNEYPVVAPRFDEPLESGMVLALEPKIALPGVGMVGVENTFEVTEQGGCSLTGEGREIIEIK